MGRKNGSSDFQTSIPQGNIFVTPLEEVMPNSMLPYAEFVILDRALPRVEDGLKPVQRRILYTMAEMGLTPDKPHKKSARIVGDCMGKYHPHGDSSVYDAMVRMAQDFNMRLTLINGHGNFGSVDGDPAAAMRYTEARLEPLALELLKDIDKETVPFSFNFDDSLLEPDILPGRYPNLLVNGANGIAVGLATSIPTHNLTEAIDACCAYIENPRITLDEMMKIIPGPDFSTGGFIIKNELKQAYETGKGKITLRARYTVETGEYGKKLIVITELPYQTNKAELLRKIMLLREEKKELLSGISDITDESDRSGMRAVITCKKDADVDAILSALLKYTDLECTFGINMVAIAGGKPRQLGLLDMIKYYVLYQQKVVVRRTRFELKEATERCHILEGLIIGVHNVDEVIRIIKSAESTADARKKLIERFTLSERQAQAILDLRLARLAKLEIKKLEDELAELKKRINFLQSVLDDKNAQWKIVKDEMREIKRKYPCERKSRIVDDAQAINVKRADVRKTVSDWTVAITAAGTVKAVEREEFEFMSAKKTSVNAKPYQLHVRTAKCKSNSDVLIFTDLGNCIRITLDELESGEFRGQGQKLSAIADGVEKNERPVNLFVIPERGAKGDLLFATKQGMVKRSPVAEYNLSKRVFQAIKLKPGDSVINVEIFDTQDVNTMFFVTKKAMCINAYPDVPVQGRLSSGVKGITLKSDDEALYFGQVNGMGEVIIATTLNGVKRVPASVIDPQARGGKGVMIADIREKGGEILFADYVVLPYVVAVTLEDGSVREISTEDIPVESRVFRGRPIGAINGAAYTAMYSLKHKCEYPDGVQLTF